MFPGRKDPNFYNDGVEILGHLQLRIMLYIWQYGPATVHEVHDALNAQVGAKQLAYTTILTVLRNLTKKKFLDRKLEGRKHRCAPLIDEASYAVETLRQIRVNLFGGDVGRMLECLAGDDGIEEVKRARIRELAAGG